MRTNLIVAALALTFIGGAFVAPAVASPRHAAHVQTAEGRGVVTAIDLKTGSITIKHEPIATLKWPAMTMTFKTKSAALLNGITVGERVDFELTSDQGKPIVTAIGPRS